MKKGCFINCISMPNDDAIQSSGVMKKVFSQIKTLRTQFEVDHILVNTYGRKENIVSKLKRRVPFCAVDNKWTYTSEVDGYDFIFFRKSDIDYTVFKFLKKIKNNNPCCKIIFEIPTYPYEKENFHGKKDFPLWVKDYVNRKRLIKCVDRIVTYSEDDIIFGIPTLQLKNGFDFSTVALRRISRDYNPNEINIIAVASFSEAHGYDRVLVGLGEYYKKGGMRNIQLHLVGGGVCIKQYEEIVERYHLDKHVIFYGWQSGIKLDEIYDKADVALDILAGVRKGIYSCSSLKSRECVAKGLPIVGACKIDFISDDYPYLLQIPHDDSPADMELLIQFVDNVYKKRTLEEVANEIREYGIQKCDIKTTLQPVVDYIMQDTK